LHGIADRFQQWLKAWSAKRIISVIEAPKGRRNEFVEPRGAAPDAVVVVLKARKLTAMVDADTAVISADSGRLASFCQNAEHAPLIQSYSVNVWRDCKRRVRSRRPARGALPPLMHL
jgi:hypothetical protein